MTAESNPTIGDAIPAGPYRVTQVSIVIPDGHCGLTGIQLRYGRTAIIPYESGWISGNNEVYDVTLSDKYPHGTAWQVAMLNNDVWDHHFQVRWNVDFTSKKAAAKYQRIGLGDIYIAANS